MKLNPLLKKYLKIAFIIPLFFFLIFSKDVFLHENNLKEAIKEVYKYDISEDYNNPEAYKTIYYNDDGSVVDIYWRFYTGISLDGRKVLFLSFIMICIFIMFIYYEERNKKTANFIYGLPIKKQKIFFYKWISGVVMFLFLFALISILIFMVYNKYIPVIKKFNAEVYNNTSVYIDKKNISLNYFWLKNFTPAIIYCILGYTYFNLFQTLFGKPIIGLSIATLSILGIFAMVRGLSSFIDFYELNFKFQPFFTTTINIIPNKYVALFYIFILYIIGRILYKNNDSGKSGNIFMFKKVKYLLYIGVFMCSGAFLFSLLNYLKLLYFGNIAIGIMILVFGGLFSTLILNKIIIINE